MVLPLPSFDVPAELVAPIRDMRADGGLGAAQLFRYFLGRHVLDIPEDERGALPGTEKAQAVFQVIPLFGPEENLFGRLGVAFGRLVDLAETGAPTAAEEVDRRICGDSRQPMGGLLFVFELFLMLERLDEGLLGEILSVGDISHNPVDLDENPAQVLGNEPILPFRQLQARLGNFTHLAVNYSSHSVLNR